MNLRSELYQQLLQLIEQAADDEPPVQPSLAIADNELRLSAVAPCDFFKQPEDYWSFVYQQACPNYLSSRLVRDEDCDISLLSDFYQRASLVSTSAAVQAEVAGERVVQRLQRRWLTDLEILLKLTEGRAIYLCLLGEAKTLLFYQITSPQALRALLWNNLVRFYSDKGMGYLDEPETTEQRIAQGLMSTDGAGSLFFVCAGQDFVLQIHATVGWFVHAANRRSWALVQQRLAMLQATTLQAVEPVA